MFVSRLLLKNSETNLNTQYSGTEEEGGSLISTVAHLPAEALRVLNTTETKLGAGHEQRPRSGVVLMGKSHSQLTSSPLKPLMGHHNVRIRAGGKLKPFEKVCSLFWPRLFWPVVTRLSQTPPETANLCVFVIINTTGNQGIQDISCPELDRFVGSAG